ncbi:hypothetical protein JL09_g6597, partial [Pichia kudriavzevii]
TVVRLGSIEEKWESTVVKLESTVVRLVSIEEKLESIVVKLESIVEMSDCRKGMLGNMKVK